MTKNIIRLYSEANLEKLYASSKYYDLTKDQIHYVMDVKRIKESDQINLIDGRSGEYKCEIVFFQKKKVKLKILNLINCAISPPDLWVIFSPLKKSRTDLIIEKCVELGVKKVIPVITDFTDIHNFNKQRNKKIMISSAQQCGCTWMPELFDLIRLENVLKEWETGRTLFFCDEKLKGKPIITVLNQLGSSPAAILVGPEGGFSRNENKLLDNYPFVKKINLGKQILRAETAIIAAISIWQSHSGNWINE